MSYVKHLHALDQDEGVNSVDRLLIARDLVRRVRGDLVFDQNTQTRLGCDVAIGGIEIAWKEIEPQ